MPAAAALAAALAGGGGAVLVVGLPGVAAEFAAPVRSLSVLGAVLALGAALALPLAALADRHGRRRLLAAAVAGMSLTAVASAFAPGLGWLAAARLFGVCFETLAITVATTLVVEMAPAGRRALVTSTLTLAAGAGIAVATVAYPFMAPHWRWLYLAYGLAGALFLPAWPFLRESETWRHADPQAGGRALLLTDPWRRRLIPLGTYSVLSWMLLQPAALFAVLLGSRLGLGAPELSAVIVVSGVAGAACFPLGGWLSDRAGRRLPGALLAVAGAVAAAATFLAGGRGHYWLGNVAWSCLASASAPVLSTWFAELFPTRARVTATALATAAAAVGGVTGMALVAANADSVGFGPAVALTGVPAALAAAGLLFLPDTRGAPLPD